jgi:hypothetical protein
MSVIELGDYTAGERDPVPIDARRLFDRQLLRRLAIVLVAVFCLATVHASAVPRARGLGRTWAVAFDGGDSFELTADCLFVLRNGRLQTLTAYGRRDGTPLWSQPLPYTATTMDAVPAAGVLLLPAGLRSVETRTASGEVLWTHYSTTTVALDATSGRELWRADGDVAAIADDTALLVHHDADGLSADRMWRVRVSDGRTVWSRATPGAYTWTTVGPSASAPDRVATVGLAGDLQVYRFADGADVSHGRVPWSVGSLTDRTYSELDGQGGLLYVLISGRAGSSVTAYQPDTLGQRWRVRSDGASGPAPCGAVVCVPVGSGFAGHDWATGALRWQVSGHAYAEPMVGDLLLTDDGRTAGHVVLDDRTGRVVADLGAGGAVWDPASATVVALTPTQSPDGRTSVARIDPRTARVFLLGTIDRIIDSHVCRLAGRQLACATVRGRLVVTTVG